MTKYPATNRPPAGRDLFEAAAKSSKSKRSKGPSKEAPMSIRVSAHGRYQIKSGSVAGVYMARAFPMPPTKARGLIAEATGKTEEAAIAALHSAIDAREIRRSEDRRTDPSTGTVVPTSDEYVEALSTVNLTKPQHAMLMALSLAEADGLTEEKVANAGSYRSTNSVQKALSNAGRMIAGYLSSETDLAGSSTNSDGTALIGFRNASAHEKKPGSWIMHPELCTAMRRAT